MTYVYVSVAQYLCVADVNHVVSACMLYADVFVTQYLHVSYLQMCLLRSICSICVRLCDMQMCLLCSVCMSM